MSIGRDRSPCCQVEVTLALEGPVCHACRRPVPQENAPASDLLTIALTWHAWGCPVLPVIFRPKKNGQGTDKIPIVEKYKHWKNGAPQTAEDVLAMPWDRAEGVGILLWPASERIVVDEDGAGAHELLPKAGILLPPTGLIYTQNGGRHHHLKVRPGVKPPDPADASRDKRAIRLLHATDAAGKPCKPAVDFLFNGMVVVAGPGYREDPDHPVDLARLAEVPEAVLALARSRNGGAGEAGPTPGTPATDYATLLRGAALGTQHDDSLKLIGHYLPKLGPAETWALMQDWCSRCNPPADKGKVRANFEDILARETAKDRADTEHLSDLGNARRLIARHRDDLRHCFPLGKWFAWDERRWADDETGEVLRRAKETVGAIYAEAAQTKDEKTRAALAAHALRSESDGRIRAMISLARSEPGIPVVPRDLDRDAWLLNLANGVLDLRVGELRPHRREDMITKLARVGYDPDAKSPGWDAFLAGLFPGKPEVARFVQKAVGYSLTGDTREQCLFFLHGTGANGKTTFVRTIQEVMGDYAKQAPPDLLMAKHGAEHPTGLADLAGARLVVCIEAQEGRRLAEALVKQMTGQDRMKARRMREDFWEYQPTHKTWLAANHKPRIRGTDYAIWRRIRLVPFTVTIPEEDQDKTLPERLKAELPGILSWAVEGCLAWQREGLAPPDEVKAATEAYREESDTMGAFIGEKCIVEPTERARAGDLYREYVKWCEENGEHPESQRRFGERLSEKGLERIKAGGGVHTWRGIGLLTAGPEPVRADDEEIPF